MGNFNSETIDLQTIETEWRKESDFRVLEIDASALNNIEVSDPS